MTKKGAGFTTAGIALLGLVTWLFVVRERPEVPRRIEQPKLEAEHPSAETGEPVDAPTSALLDEESVPFGADRERAAQLREALQSMVATAASQQPATEPIEGASNAGEANVALEPYVHDIFARRIGPVVGACYEELLQQSPGASGDIALELAILGSAETGAVVVDVAFGEQTTLTDEGFSRCSKEAILDLVFEAPPGGRPVSVKQMLSLSP